MTLTEIAEYAHVSTGTVDRVIHHRKGVSEETRCKIESIINEYGYQPNPIASQLKRNKTFVVGVLLADLDTGCGYQTALFSGMEQARDSLKPFQVELILAVFDRTIDGDAFAKGRELLTNQIDAFITSPVVPKEFMDLLPYLNGIPYVFVDTPLNMTNPLISIAQNPYKGGYCAGRIMRMFQPSGMFACIRMYVAAYNLRERYRGFADFMSRDSASTVVDTVCTDFTEEGLYNFLEELFALHPDIKGIFIPHAEVQLASYYLINTGLKSSVTLIGYDLLEKNKQGLLDGSIDCIIGQRPEAQGFDAVHKLYQLCMLHQNIPNKVDIPIDVYYRENVPS